MKMKKVSSERGRKSDTVFPRRVSFEESAASMEEEADEPQQFTRAPGRSARLDLALLGLIAEVPGVSGYDILKIFDLSMKHYWHAHPSQIYPTLEQMEEVGVIKRRKVIQRSRPNKTLYTITPAGERMLIDWLQSPFEGLRLKHPPLLRCRFLGHLGADGAREILSEERLSWVLNLKRYREIEQKYFAGDKAHRDVNTMFTWFTVRRGIDWMEENIRWCDWALEEIERNRALFPAVSMRAGLKPLIPYDEVQRRVEAEGKRKYARRKEREKARAAASGGVARG
jgi:PadR family transcriptional regulator AphA